MKKILLVENDAHLRHSIAAALEEQHYELIVAGTLSEATRLAAQEQPSLILLEVTVPETMDLVAQLRKAGQNPKVILMTAESTPETAIRALREQACDLLVKPFSTDDVLSAVSSAVALSPGEIAVEVLSARPDWIELRVPCSPAAIGPLERMMTQLETDLPHETRDGIIYAFREMLRNAIEYGGRNDPSQFVDIGYLHSPRIILYRIKDPGQGFEIESLQHAAILNPDGDPTRHERIREDMGMRPGGFGILIARNLVDEMIYNERHNEVVLIKYLS